MACPAPPTISFASVAQSGGGVFPTGRATYTCSSGYQLQISAASTLSCGSDGTWQGTRPVCIGVPCQTLSLTNGSVSYSNSQSYPSTATFSCNGGGFLNGAKTLQCQPDGSWSGARPTCVAANVSQGMRVRDAYFG